jgi:hypothetical protein
MNERFLITPKRVETKFGLMWVVTDTKKGYSRHYRTRKNAEGAIASVIAFIAKNGEAK